MKKTKFGTTNLMVSRMGIGTSEIRNDSSRKVEEILTYAFDSGVNFVDTAACYGDSEELIGKTIADRRDEFVLSTKAGHLVGTHSGQAWTAQTIRDSIERSLKRMNTDHLDIVHLHSCSIKVMEAGDVIQALQDAKQAGKTRYIGYSGDNDAAEWAIESSLFDSLQTSFNLVDQKARQKKVLSRAQDKGMGIIAKRPIANAVWKTHGMPSAYAREYYRRAGIMSEPGPIPGAPAYPILIALGFVLSHDEVDTAIVGTNDPEHMRENIEWYYRDLPLDRKVIDELHQRFDRFGLDWPQEA